MASWRQWLAVVALCFIAFTPEATPHPATNPPGADGESLAGRIARVENILSHLQKAVDDIVTDQDVGKEYFNRRQSVLEKKLEWTLTGLLQPRPTPRDVVTPAQTERPPMPTTQRIPTNGDIRLVHPTGCQTEGRLEIFLQSTWGTVCDDNFDNTDATVACRQLGFSSGLKLSHTLPGEGPIWLDEMNCNQDDTRLLDCTHSPIGREDCGHDEDVYIACYNGTSRANCPGDKRTNDGHGDIRLVHPTGCQTQGRLEIFAHGTWGTVCDDSFDAVDATVACRQLGFSRGTTVPKAYHGMGTIWLDEVSCNPTNTRLLDCGHNPLGVSDCGHNEDVYIACYNGTSILNCPGEESDLIDVGSGAVRLVHPTGCQNEGRLEISLRGQWGTVCDDNFDNEDATVACRQMGFSHGIKLGHTFAGPGPIWLDGLSCVPENRRLVDCVHEPIGTHDCTHSEDVYIACYNGTSRLCCPGLRAPNHEDNSIRLVGGACPGEGRLEVLHGGTWGTICNDQFGEDEANVACRQLGFDTGVPMKAPAGSGRIWLDDVNCTPQHNAITECDAASWGEHDCSHAEDVGVSCFNNP